MKEKIYKIFYPKNKYIVMGVLFIIVSMMYLICLDKFNTPISYLLYLLMSYFLTVFVIKIVEVIKRKINKIIDSSTYLTKYKNDYILRHKVSLYFSLSWNIIYAIFKLVLGVMYKSIWFISFAIYYLLVIIIRINIANVEIRHSIDLKEEYLKYRKCGVILLFLNIILTIIVFVTINQSITVTYHTYIAISMAIYTFFILIESIISFVKYRKYNRPLVEMAKIVGVVVSLISILSLEIVMLSTFGDISRDVSKLLVILTGLGISIIISIICVCIIIKSTKWLKKNK